MHTHPKTLGLVPLPAGRADLGQDNLAILLSPVLLRRTCFKSSKSSWEVWDVLCGGTSVLPSSSVMPAFLMPACPPSLSHFSPTLPFLHSRLMWPERNSTWGQSQPADLDYS